MTGPTYSTAPGVIGSDQHPTRTDPAPGLTRFYVTIGLRARILADGYVTIDAPDETTARLFAREAYGELWAFIYREAPQEKHHPRGSWGTVVLTESRAWELDQ